MMETCRWTLLIYANNCYFFLLEINIFGFLKMRGILNDKKASANKFLSFAFENSLYYKRRKRRIHCMSLVVLFFTYNTHLGNKKQKTLQ